MTEPLLKSLNTSVYEDRIDFKDKSIPLHKITSVEIRRIIRWA